MPAVPEETRRAGSGDSGDRARRGIDPADNRAPCIGDVEVARGVQRRAPRVVKLRGRGPAAVADRAGSRDGGNDARCGIDLADTVVAAVGDIDVAVGVRRHAAGVAQPRGCRWAAVAAEAERSGSCDGRNDARCGVDLADAVVAAVGDVNVAVRVRGYAPGLVQLRRGCLAAVAGESGRAGSRKGGNDARRGIDFADAVGVAVSDVNIARAVRRNVQSPAQLRRRRRAAVAPGACRAGSRKSGNDVRCGVDFADAPGRVGDIDVARGVRGNVSGLPDLRRCRRAAVAAETPHSGSRDSRNDARCGIDLANAAVFQIGDVEVAVGVRRRGGGLADLRRCRRAAVAAEAESSGSGDGGNGARCGVDFADAGVPVVSDINVARGVRGYAFGVLQPSFGCRASVAGRPGAGCRMDNPVAGYARRLRTGRCGRRQRANEQTRRKPYEVQAFQTFTRKASVGGGGGLALFHAVEKI